MEQLVNSAVQNIQISGIRQMANRVAAYPEAIALTIGQPDFPTPGHIIQAGKKALDQNRTLYTPNAGLAELRRAAARFAAVKYGLDYDAEREVIVTAGASQALDIALRTIVGPGSEVVIPGPIYPGYEPIVRMCGGTPVYADTRASGFKLTASLLKPLLNERTRAVILCYPSNPTGRVMTGEELREVADLLRGRPILLISDEIYSELVYDAPHRSIAALPGMKEQTIVINGLSKSHSMTGWRIGFAFASAPIAGHMLKVHQYNVTCASSISQYAAVEALTAGIDDAEPMKREYRARRDFVYDRLQRIGLEGEKPEGAFYLFPSIRRFGLSSSAFAIKLLEQERVAVVPGDAFSVYGEGYIRISYATSMDVLENAMDKLEVFVGRLG